MIEMTGQKGAKRVQKWGKKGTKEGKLVAPLGHAQSKKGAKRVQKEGKKGAKRGQKRGKRRERRRSSQ